MKKIIKGFVILVVKIALVIYDIGAITFVIVRGLIKLINPRPIRGGIIVIYTILALIGLIFSLAGTVASGTPISGPTFCFAMWVWSIIFFPLIFIFIIFFSSLVLSKREE